MHFGDLLGRARAATAAGTADPALHGLARLAGGMTHHVFAPLDDSNLVVKVFHTTSRDEPKHEWDALVTLTGSGITPEPVHFDAGDPTIVVMTRVSGSSLPAGSLGAEHAREIGLVHRLVHRTVPEVRRPPSHSGLRAASAALMLDDRHGSTPVSVDASDVVARAWRAAEVWIASADVEGLLYSNSLSFSRGDPNLSNYLGANKVWYSSTGRTAATTTRRLSSQTWRSTRAPGLSARTSGLNLPMQPSSRVRTEHE
jgi:hypothetical protein